MESAVYRDLLELVKSLDLAVYLEGLGYFPQSIRKNGLELWYLSPLRDEATASFKVSRKINSWFDFGMGRGGNLVDFGLLYFRCSLPEFLDRFQLGFVENKARFFRSAEAERSDEPESKIRVLKVGPLFAWPLKNYLHQRAIPLALADRYCRQVEYDLNGSKLFGIGFKNDAGGYEIRSSLFKHSSSPKEITTFDLGSEMVQVFEGFMDFLSCLALPDSGPSLASDFVILNGAGLFERARPFMERHAEVGLWLDQDTTGRAYTHYALGLGGEYRDRSHLYEGFKDLNDFLTNRPLEQKKALSLRVR